MSQTQFDSAANAEPRFQCRHVFTAGHRCSSPCLRGEEFCYYHHTTRRPIQNPQQRKARTSTFTLPNMEDRGAIQLAISAVLERIAANEIDPKRAGLLLYGLQIASLNLPRQSPQARPLPTVVEVVADPQHGPLAPRCEMGKDENEMGPAERMLLELEREFPDIPTIQATAEKLATRNSKLNRTASLLEQCPNKCIGPLLLGKPRLQPWPSGTHHKSGFSPWGTPLPGLELLCSNTKTALAQHLKALSSSKPNRPHQPTKLRRRHTRYTPQAAAVQLSMIRPSSSIASNSVTATRCTVMSCSSASRAVCPSVKPSARYTACDCRIAP